MAKSKKKQTGVEPFEEGADTEIENEEQEDNEMAKDTAKAKARRASEVEDEDEDDDEVEEDAVDEDEDDDADDDENGDDDEEDDEDDEFAQFKPFIVHEDQEWDLDEVLSNASGGEVVIIYHLESGHWYKLQPIKVGEAGISS